MILINIVEYDSGLGAMTSIAGIEDGKNFLVQKNIALNKKNEFIYNNNHFLDHYIDYDPGDYSIDLFIASPFFGDKIQKRGSSNFETNELNELLHEFLNLGEMMLRAGGEIKRVEDTLMRVGAAYGAE